MRGNGVQNSCSPLSAEWRIGKAMNVPTPRYGERVRVKVVVSGFPRKPLSGREVDFSLFGTLCIFITQAKASLHTPGADFQFLSEKKINIVPKNRKRFGMKGSEFVTRLSIMLLNHQTEACLMPRKCLGLLQR